MFGKLTYAQDDILNHFIGEFKDGLKHGNGTLVWKSGDTYVGLFSKDLRTGNGTYSFVNGDNYEGEWLNGEKNGFGKFTFAKEENIIADYYIGENKDNVFHGNGTLVWTDGTTYVGE